MKLVGIFKTIIVIFFVVLFAGISSHVNLYAEDPTPTPTSTGTNPDVSKLQGQIADLQNKISDSQKQQQTLSSQIGVMDNQIKLTELRINAAREEILELTADIDTATKKVSSLEDSLSRITKVLLNRIRATYQVGTVNPLQVFMSSQTASDYFTKENYLKIIQEHDKKLIYETQQARNDYANQKGIFEEKKKKIEALEEQLEGYTAQLNRDKQAKKTLLAETQGSEATYQRLLSQARAQLAGFSRFVTSQGGASILSGQTKCDDWGCYYNQRDSQWGNNALNGTQYTLASDGCLVTVMAMVYTHYGHRNVTPQTINSDRNNFASYYPAFLNKRISADGKSAERIYSAIDGELGAGRPVVVGVGRGPDHFILLISGKEGNYIMHDPFVPNGYKIPFTDHYSLGSINSIEWVKI